MKVLHILYALRPSGMEKMLHASAKYWATYGVQAEILVNDDDEGPFAAELKKDFPVYRISWSRSRWHLFLFFRLLKRGGYDVVHVHTSRGYLGFSFVARLAGIGRVLYTVHSVFVPRNKWRLYAQRLVHRAAQLLGATFISPGISVQENEKKRFLTDSAVVWNWVNENEYSHISDGEHVSARKKLGIEKDMLVIVSVGNCHTVEYQLVKNHRLIIEAIAQMPQDMRVRLVYFHVGDERDGKPEQVLARELGVADQIRFVGRQNDIRQFLAAADLFVMPSLHEGLSVAVIEALLCGLPTMVTNVPGLLDFVHLIPEVFVMGLTVEDARAALERVSKIPRNVLRTQGEKARAVALNYFTVTHGCSKLMSLYKGERIK